MDARVAEMRFKEADTLYREGRYDEAMDRLIELDETFPNTPNILFPLARCLRRVGRNEDALAICDDLIKRCGDTRATQLRDYIRANYNSNATPPPLPVTDDAIENLYQHAHAGVLDDLILSDTPLSVAPVAADDPPPYKKWALIGGAVVAVLALLFAIPLLLPDPEPGVPVATTAAPTTTPEQPLTEAQLNEAQIRQDKVDLVTRFCIALVTLVLSLAVALYATLRLCGKLPYNVVVDDIINVGFMSVALIVLSVFLPCIGLIISIVILFKYYELVIVEFLILVGFYLGANFVTGLLFLLVTSASTG